MRHWVDLDTWDPRRAVTTLAEPMGPGPRGEPAHAKGTPVELSQPVHLEGFSEPVMAPSVWLSVLLTRQAARCAQEAERLKANLMASVDEPSPAGRGSASGTRFRWLAGRSELYPYLEVAATSVVMAHAALEAFTAEQIPADYRHDDGITTRSHDQLITQLGLGKRLSQVLSRALQCSNPYGTDLWRRFVKLKALRDVVHHVRLPALYDATEPSVTVIQRLLNDDPGMHVETVTLFMRHYGLEAPALFSS